LRLMAKRTRVDLFLKTFAPVPCDRQETVAYNLLF